MLNGRRIRTRLDLLHPCQPTISKSVLRQKEYYDANTKMKRFLVGDSVWVKNFRDGKCWLPGTINQRKGEVTYEVTVEGSRAIWHRHANQLRDRAVITPSTTNNTDTNSTTTSTNSPRTSIPQALRHSTRIRWPRIPWSPT